MTSNNGAVQQMATSEEMAKVLSALPDHIVLSMEEEDRALDALAQGSAGFEFLYDDFRKWLPGTTVTVAFLDGETALHQMIAESTQQITDACNIFLDFGFDPATGSYRSWSTTDTTYSAHIRVSFGLKGYFSLVGTDSITPTIGEPDEPAGGRPNQVTLNLGGFKTRRPFDWQGIARHEFMHALAFQHEHQMPQSACVSELRFDDDLGYIPTLDADGVYVADANGRRPGIYTFLAGEPNKWSRARVDHNLRPRVNPGIVAGPFDTDSIMLYRFPSLFYRSSPSPCAPTGDGINLSAGDVAGLQEIYPVVLPVASPSWQARNLKHELLRENNFMSDAQMQALMEAAEIQVEQ